MIPNLKVFAKFNLNLTRSIFLDSKSDPLRNFQSKMFSDFIFFDNQAFYDGIEKATLTFSWCILTVFWKRVSQQDLISLKQFYVRRWCVLILLNQNLTRWKNFLSKTEDFRKNWLVDALVMKNMVQKLFSIPVFFSQIHSL